VNTANRGCVGEPAHRVRWALDAHRRSESGGTLGRRFRRTRAVARSSPRWAVSSDWSCSQRRVGP